LVDAIKNIKSMYRIKRNWREILVPLKIIRGMVLVAATMLLIHPASYPCKLMPSK